MLKHIVMYKFHPQANGKTKAENLEIAAQLAALMEKEIPQLRSFQCGIAAEGAKPDNYDVTLVCELDDFDALAEYKLNPAHKAFGTHCHACASDRAAIDYLV